MNADYLEDKWMQEQEDYIRELEGKLEEASLHPGYIAKAGPDAQQAADYADQLMKLQAAFVKVSQENEALRDTLHAAQDELSRASHALARKLNGTW